MSIQFLIFVPITAFVYSGEEKKQVSSLPPAESVSSHPMDFAEESKGHDCNAAV